MNSTDAWHIALAIFLVLTALGLTFVFVRLAGVLGRVATMLEGLTGEIVPMLGKASVTIDHVNEELVKVGEITDHAVDATAKADETVRAVSSALAKPAKAVAGVTAGIGHAFSSFKSRRTQRGGIV
jgi:hypothetical protein